MDLETENRIAAILLKEAAELRREAQKEGALAYLRQPTVRSRPNSRFLTATVRGVQQANRVVEVNEMWRLREKQLELDNKLRGGRNDSSSARGSKDVSESRKSTSREHNVRETSASTSSKKRFVRDFDSMEDEGLRDDEIDEFLYSRTKRGRGAVGSRMDETGPYLPLSPDSKRNVLENQIEEEKKTRVLLGPLKPHTLMSNESSDYETCGKRKEKSNRRSHKTKHKDRKKRNEKEKSKDKDRKKRKEKSSKSHK